MKGSILKILFHLRISIFSRLDQYWQSWFSDHSIFSRLNQYWQCWLLTYLSNLEYQNFQYWINIDNDDVLIIQYFQYWINIHLRISVFSIKEQYWSCWCLRVQSWINIGNADYSSLTCRSILETQYLQYWINIFNIDLFDHSIFSRLNEYWFNIH